MGSINNHTISCKETAAKRLRTLIESKSDIIIAPGVYDGLSARTALEVGFDCLYMTGAGTVASRLGQPDLGFASLDDMSNHAEMIANLDPAIPLIADADTGYGGPNMVARTVARYHRAGVAALHIEDQIQTKRCGHLGGKAVVDREVFTQRIKAAYQARLRLGSDIVIIARTDALQTHDYDEAVARLEEAFAAGADVAFLEGILSREQAEQVCKDLSPKPVLLNMVENGATPSFTPAECQEMGFRIIIFPFATIFPAYQASREALVRLKKTGKTGLASEYTPRKLFTIVGLEEASKIDAQAGGEMYGAV